MENFAPGLRDAILTLTEAFRFVLFFICVTGLIVQVPEYLSEGEMIKVDSRTALYISRA